MQLARLAVIGLFGIDVAGVACSSSYGTGGGASNLCAGQGAAQTVTAGGNLRFSPDSILIAVGQKVCWQNSSGLSHTVTSDTGTVLAATLNNGTFTVKTFTSAGTVAYHCVPHQGNGMVGKVVIQ